MQFILLIAGLILKFAGSDWFSGADTVGVICLVLFAVISIIQLLVPVAAGWFVSRIRN